MASSNRPADPPIEFVEVALDHLFDHLPCSLGRFGVPAAVPASGAIRELLHGKVIEVCDQVLGDRCAGYRRQHRGREALDRGFKSGWEPSRASSTAAFSTALS